MSRRQQLRSWFRGMVNDPLSVLGLALAVELALFSAVLLWPGEPSFETSRSYQIMARMAGETTWGLLYAAVGGFCIVAVLLANRAVRKAGVLLCGVAHGALALLFGLANPFGGGIGFLSIQMLLAYYLIWWEGRDA